ncbi:hypothetical protein PHMEG_00014989 [Phytophthora megakarya]|uniref:Tf2-1-like SH3-like domain-containing protein n=1 Tax=Phytophthora megakarya TaxID=4795 RepID=A0A225W3G6_9STRA|nr:hypothetical protein PHMEG_00014989 [Phytophthora megakarya]
MPIRHYAKTTSLKRGAGKQIEALAWRREINHQQRIALEMAMEYQVVEKARRVWLYMDRVKPGLVKKLTHLWHGPFRVKRKVEEFAYELDLPNKSRYRFYPLVHVSRLKASKARMARDAAEDARFDFDEEVLPEDSWEPDEVAGEFEVEAILSDGMNVNQHG